MISISWAWTQNLGDDLQSLALAAALGRIDCLWDRDNLPTSFSPGERGFIHGWISRDRPKPFDGHELSRVLLPVSIHIAAPRLYATEHWNHYWQNCSIVRTRDLATAEHLRARGVGARFSGCLTLGLGNQFQTDGCPWDYDLVTEKEVKFQTESPIRFDPHLPSSIQFDICARVTFALLWLKLLAGAQRLQSARLHALLPAYSFGVEILPQGLATHSRLPTGSVNRLSGFEHLIGEKPLPFYAMCPDAPSTEKDVLALVSEQFAAVQDWAGSDNDALGLPMNLDSVELSVSELCSKLLNLPKNSFGAGLMRGVSEFKARFRNLNPAGEQILDWVCS